MEDEDKEPVDGLGIPLTFEMGDFGITLLLDAWEGAPGRPLIRHNLWAWGARSERGRAAVNLEMRRTPFAPIVCNTISIVTLRMQ
jgi:hypothetical protein